MKHSFLKRLLLVALFSCAFSMGEAVAQITVTPDLLWRRSCEPPTVADNSLVVDLGADPAPGEEQTTEESGEDWWYDVIPFDKTGAVPGYMASGYATWVNVDMDETAATDGLFDANVAPPDVDRPVLDGEVLSSKLAVLSRYNQHGKMIWCKSYCLAEEGAMSVIETADGGFAFTGWGKATVDVNGNHLLYNPEVGGVNFDMTDPAFLIENRGSKMLVGKIDADGNLLWLNAYGFYDMSLSPSPDNIFDYNAMKTSAIGYDLVQMSNGNIRAVGHSEEAPGSNTQKVFMIDIDQNGMVVDKLNNKKLFGLSNYRSSAREIEPSPGGSEFFVAGLQLNKSGAGLGTLNKSDAILFKVDLAMDQVDFANDTWNGNPIDGSADKAAVRYSEGDNNIGWDVKVLNDGKVAWAFIEKCNKCLFSGENKGQGRIFLFSNEAGTALTKLINLQSINSVGFSQVQAFDMKMGLIATSSGGFACVTTIKGQTLSQEGQTLQNLIKADLEAQVDNGETIHPNHVANFWNTDAYVAKFRNNGTLIWDKSWDAFDGPAEYYPGDYKEQECMYRILEDHDGGLVVTGNNSRNKDDYYMAKILSDCPQYVYYDRHPNHATTEVPIGGTITWDATTVPGGVTRVRGILTILPNATLIVDGITVEFADTKAMDEVTKLVIKQGGHLILKNGAKLTSLSTCPGNMWDGIEVWGDSDQPQTAINQGWITMSSGSTIEHARIAVALWRPDFWDATGGVIQAENSSFVNNIRDVAFMNYQYGTSFIHANKSTFENVDFITNDDFKVHTPMNHVSLYKVHTVNFKGCHFMDNRTGVVSELRAGGHVVNCGIRSIDSRYVVSELTPSNRSSFERLDFGIYASNTHTEKSIVVKETDFTNNIYGVELVNANSPTIVLNNFNFSNTLNAFTDGSQYGIHAIRTKELRIEENNFVNTDAPNQTYGVVCSDLGEEDQEIYKNVFTNLHVGNYAQGQNRSTTATTAVAGTNGLEFLCNSNTDNRYDHVIKGTLWNLYDEPEYGVSNTNGTNVRPSGNEFTALGNLCEDINNESDYPMFYYYNAGEAPVETCVDDAVFTSLGTSTNYCVSRLGDWPSGILPSSTVSQLSNSFATYSNLLSSKTQTYLGLLDGGNTQSLLQTVAGMTTSNSSQVHQVLIGYSPYLSEAVIKAVLDHPSSVNPHQQGQQLVMANIDVARNTGFMDYLSTKAYPMPASMIQGIQTQVDNGATTDRFHKEVELAELSGQRSFAADMLIRHYKNNPSTNHDLVKYWIEEKDDVFVKKRLIDYYLERNDLNNASTEISNLQNSLQGYPASVQQELSDVIQYKTKMTALLGTPGAVADLNATDHQYMSNMAQNGSGTAKYQAQELLCFFYGECASRAITLGSNTSSSKQGNPFIESQEADAERAWILYPNPASDLVTIELPENEEEAVVSVFTLTGQMVAQQVTSSARLTLNTREIANGTYFLNVQLSSGENLTKKIIIQH